MDISKETDVTKLKALAFDCVQAIDVQQANLRAIQTRLAEIDYTTTKK